MCSCRLHQTQALTQRRSKPNAAADSHLNAPPPQGLRLVPLGAPDDPAAAERARLVPGALRVGVLVCTRGHEEEGLGRGSLLEKGPEVALGGDVVG